VSPQVKRVFSPEETLDFGQSLGRNLLPHHCILLSGPLGAGKTCLVKGIGKALGIAPEAIHSPTYGLHHAYYGDKTLHHFDLYRLQSPDEFCQRGFLDILETEDPIAMEWPTKLDTKLLAQKKLILIEITPIKDDERLLKVTYASPEL